MQYTEQYKPDKYSPTYTLEYINDYGDLFLVAVNGMSEDELAEYDGGHSLWYQLEDRLPEIEFERHQDSLDAKAEFEYDKLKGN